MITDPKYKHMSLVMKAMAHPARLYIIDLLSEREHCVCELQKHIGTDMSTVSRHLSVLKEAGLIANRKVNNQVWYRLLCPCVLDFYACMTQVRSDGNV
ncbi:MAG TPA: metalloregulator ArsR/SmtB family transcription factor [Candidatus Cloacimonadota bacterium]|nr:metalloregulator ArsR/SmtB family transcription factor [Candidatus Cloacimonadota bacterium]